jgi:hypothetical protein
MGSFVGGVRSLCVSRVSRSKKMSAASLPVTSRPSRERLHQASNKIGDTSKGRKWLSGNHPPLSHHPQGCYTAPLRKCTHTNSRTKCDPILNAIKFLFFWTWSKLFDFGKPARERRSPAGCYCWHGRFHNCSSIIIEFSWAPNVVITYFRKIHNVIQFEYWWMLVNFNSQYMIY